MKDDTPRNPGRETLVSIVLALLLGGIFVFFFLLVLSGRFGVVPEVLLAIVGFVAVGFFHYVVWGYSFSKEVAGEREEEENRRRMEAEEHIYDPHSHHRY